MSRISCTVDVENNIVPIIYAASTYVMCMQYASKLCALQL